MSSPMVSSLEGILKTYSAQGFATKPLPRRIILFPEVITVSVVQRVEVAWDIKAT